MWWVLWDPVLDMTVREMLTLAVEPLLEQTAVTMWFWDRITWKLEVCSLDLKTKIILAMSESWSY